MNKQRENPIARVLTLAGVLGVVVGSAACARMEPVPAAQPAPPGAVVMTDADVSGIFIQANRGEVRRAELAIQRAENPQVRQFAERLRTDHGRAAEATTDLARRRGITPARNDLARDLETGTNRTVESLQARTGADFDQAYIAYEIANHEWMLRAIDQSLIPATADPQLRTQLQNARPTVVEHLEQARQIQAQIGMPAQQPMQHQQHMQPQTQPQQQPR